MQMGGKSVSNLLPQDPFQFSDMPGTGSPDVRDFDGEIWKEMTGLR